MNKILTVVLALSILAALLISGGCGSSSGSPKGSSLVTISIGGGGKSASLAIRPATLLSRAELQLRQAWRTGLAVAAPFPAEAENFRVTVTAADMATISRTLPVPDGDQVITDTFEVPNGTDRLFTGELLNLAGNPVYRKTQTHDLAGDAVTVDFADWQVVAPLGTVIVVGTVKDSSTGVSLEGATVTFGARPPVTTSVIGMYFMELAPGTYPVTVSVAGYSSSSQNISVEPSPTGDFVVIDLVVSQRVAAKLE